MISDPRERWGQLKAIFHGALEQPADARADWLARACGGDAGLLAAARRLLRSHDTVGGFLEQPATVDLMDLLNPDEGGTPGSASGVDGDASNGEPHWAPGSRVGHYVIVEELGRGGMGVVYLAEDERLGRRVALKALPPAIARRADLRERLRREARAAATITHPAVATVYALEEIGDHLLLAAEYVRGETLRHVIARGPVDAPLARAVATSVARALVASHAAGVVHRDLKPENIVVADDGDAKVVDFGIALIEGDDRPRLTGTHHALGTPAYMAPEQLLGQAVDARTDIWAFGVVLGEMLLGHHPLAAGTRGRESLVPSESSATTERTALLSIADRCAQTTPEARYGSAAVLLADLLGGTSGSALIGSTGAATPLAGVAPVDRSRWWWEFHQGTVALAYIAILFAVWRARVEIGGLPGRAVFIGATAAAVVAAFVRWHLVFTSRLYAVELGWVRARAAWFVHVADWAFVATLVVGAFLVGDRSALDVVLFACAIGATVAFLVIEPVTARAAFGEARSPTRP